jgi:hypothetical protein
MLDISRSELKLQLESYGNAMFDEVTKGAVYDGTKVPNQKEKDERSRQKSRVFSKLLEALNAQEIEGQKSRKESVQTAVCSWGLKLLLVLRFKRRAAAGSRPDPSAGEGKWQ